MLDAKSPQISNSDNRHIVMCPSASGMLMTMYDYDYCVWFNYSCRVQRKTYNKKAHHDTCAYICTAPLRATYVHTSFLTTSCATAMNVFMQIEIRIPTRRISVILDHPFRATPAVATYAVVSVVT